MNLDEAANYLTGRGRPHICDRARAKLTLGSAASSTSSAPGYPHVLVLEEPVLIVKDSAGIWDVLRFHPRVLVASFRKLKDAVDFAVVLVDTALPKKSESPESAVDSATGDKSSPPFPPDGE